MKSSSFTVSRCLSQGREWVANSVASFQSAGDPVEVRGWRYPCGALQSRGSKNHVDLWSEIEAGSCSWRSDSSFQSKLGPVASFPRPFGPIFCGNFTWCEGSALPQNPIRHRWNKLSKAVVVVVADGGSPLVKREGRYLRDLSYQFEAAFAAWWSRGSSRWRWRCRSSFQCHRQPIESRDQILDLVGRALTHMPARFGTSLTCAEPCGLERAQKP